MLELLNQHVLASKHDFVEANYQN